MHGPLNVKFYTYSTGLVMRKLQIMNGILRVN